MGRRGALGGRVISAAVFKIAHRIKINANTKEDWFPKPALTLKKISPPLRLSLARKSNCTQIMHPINLVS